MERLTDFDNSPYPLVDLLQATPAFRIDAEATDTTIVFGFSGSSASGLFAEALESASFPPSSWQPDGFENDLFVRRFVRDCLQGPQPLVSLGHLTALISRPPSELASVSLRQDILSELISSAGLRRQLLALHGSLVDFRTNLEGSGQSDRYNTQRRQLDILRQFSALIALMATDFVSARSGLERIHAFGQEAMAGEGFTSLQALLSYEAQSAVLDFRVQMGADGRVRHLELLKLKEPADSPFVASPLRRWGAKLEMLFRGYSFSSTEVMSRLVDAVFEGVRPYFVALVQLLGDLEFYVGALRFYDRAEAAGLPVCLPDFCEPGAQRNLQGLFNRLLLGAGVRPIPCSIVSDRHDATLLITGPNSGGKTRLLQSLGYAQLLGQSGMFVPAKSARLAPAPGLLMSLIQETTADQTEGRLGVELMRIRSLFERLPGGAIVILDELCSGTNPSEGEEIFELVVRMLSKLRPQAFITTHFLEFASRLEKQNQIEGLRFLQVVLGPNQEPTYQFAPGVATTSLASQAAARLGVTGEQLLLLIDSKLRDARGGEGA